MDNPDVLYSVYEYDALGIGVARAERVVVGVERLQLAHARQLAHRVVVVLDAVDPVGALLYRVACAQILDPFICMSLIGSLSALTSHKPLELEFSDQLKVKVYSVKCA